MPKYEPRASVAVAREAAALRKSIADLYFTHDLLMGRGLERSGPLDGVSADGIRELRALRRDLKKLLAKPAI